MGVIYDLTIFRARKSHLIPLMKIGEKAISSHFTANAVPEILDTSPKFWTHEKKTTGKNRGRNEIAEVGRPALLEKKRPPRTFTGSYR